MRLIYISPLPWASFAQRPHKFVEWFHARFGGSVLWIEPYPTRLPELSDSRRTIIRTKENKSEIPEWLTVVRPISLPIEPLAGSGFLNRILWRAALAAVDEFMAKGDCRIVVGKPSELALQVLARTPHCISFYDAMDDFPAFYGGLSRKAMKRREKLLAARVSQILTSSSALQQRFATHHHHKVTLVHNACAVNILPSAVSLRKSRSAPILGYVGTIGQWFDWALICGIANQNPALHIHLIGPVYSAPPASLPPNIKLLHACDHSTAIQAMQQFSVGLIPFRCTDLTASVDPIKYYEYRALGLPVLSTSFGEMALRSNIPGVFLMDAGVDFQHLVETALSYEFDKKTIEAFRIRNSWESRFDASSLASSSTNVNRDIEVFHVRKRSGEMHSEKNMEKEGTFNE